MDTFKLKTSVALMCKSTFYDSFSSINDLHEYQLSKGLNIISCEIDEEYFAISYLISRYKHLKQERKYLSAQTEVYIDGVPSSLQEFSEKCCYIDTEYFEFSHRKSVRKLVEKGIAKNGIKESADEIRDKFMITDFRFERNINCVGNERYKAMAAIAYAWGKEVFCFPWFSKTRFESYHRNLTDLLEVLGSLGKIVILPIGKFK